MEGQLSASSSGCPSFHSLCSGFRSKHHFFLQKTSMAFCLLCFSFSPSLSLPPSFAPSPHPPPLLPPPSLTHSLSRSISSSSSSSSSSLPRSFAHSLSSSSSSLLSSLGWSNTAQCSNSQCSTQTTYSSH